MATHRACQRVLELGAVVLCQDRINYGFLTDSRTRPAMFQHAADLFRSDAFGYADFVTGNPFMPSVQMSNRRRLVRQRFEEELRSARVVEKISRTGIRSVRYGADIGADGERIPSFHNDMLMAFLVGLLNSHHYRLQAQGRNTGARIIERTYAERLQSVSESIRLPP